MDEQTLEPCPFCGSERITWCDTTPAGQHWFSCDECACEGPPKHIKAEAIAAWNRRAAHSVIAGKVAELSWQPIETAPHAMHFLAAYFYEEGGEWIYDVAMLHRDHACGSNEGSGPFTHWRMLPDPPAALAPYPERRHD